MREIKFRAWLKEEKRMVNWENINVELEDGYGGVLDNSKYSGFEDLDDLTTSDFILMQYTGLKDNSGKEIYEGDILDHFATFGYVIFDEGMFTLSSSRKGTFGHRQPLCYIDTSQCQVISNIYEKPELVGDRS